MRCMVCDGATQPYFDKDFAGDCGLQVVNYRECVECRFAFSATHFSMSEAEWGKLNELYHRNYFGAESNPDDPRWMQRLRAQTKVITALSAAGVFPAGLPAYDYGCGDGKLVDMLREAGVSARKYDKFLTEDRSGYLRDEDVRRGGFGLVINTSVLEHVRDIGTLDEIAHSVDPESGVMAVHTLVSARVPKDPAWFYLLPVHLSFYTNASMEILFRRWRFEASVYEVESRMWFFFRHRQQAQVAYEAACAVSQQAHHKIGFVDYWK